eukprot:2354792-Rhodomonas_salina.3
MDDQYTAYQLLYVTFLVHHKTILDKARGGVGGFATQAWKDIWQSCMIEDAVESADLGNQMWLAKFFEGGFKVYIDTIVDLNIKLTSLSQQKGTQIEKAGLWFVSILSRLLQAVGGDYA